MIDKIWFNTNLVLLDQGVCTPFLKHKNYFKCIEMSKCLLRLYSGFTASLSQFPMYKVGRKIDSFC